MAKIIDVRGGGKPLLGRLRGCVARHEIRPTLDLDNEHIYFKANDAHLMFRDKVPSPLPDALSNTERQLVVSKKLADALLALEKKIEIVPVRLVDRNGKTVSKDYVLASPKRVVNCVEGGDGDMIGGYIHGVIKNEKGPEDDVPPVFRVGYTFVIACSDAAAGKLKKFSGLDLVAFEDYVEELLPFPATPYEILKCGTEGAELQFAKEDYESKLEKGESVAKTWPKQPVLKMQGAKSRKKIVDFTEASGAPLISEKARAVLEPFGLDGVELLPAQVKDHAGNVVKGTYWLFHVTGTQPFVDVDESDIAVVHDLLWTAREIVVDESRLTARPAFFRVPGARYPWVFVRRDVIEAMEKGKLTGFRTEHPAYYSHSVEGGGIPHVC